MAQTISSGCFAAGDATHNFAARLSFKRAMSRFPVPSPRLRPARLLASAVMVIAVSGVLPVRAEMVDADTVTLQTIEGRLNEAGVCTSLAFDLRVVSALVGFPIPSFIPIDTNLRWNQSRHAVTRFASTPTEVRLDFQMGCQPGSNGAVLEFIGLEPKDVRLADAVACTGERAGDGSLETLVCTPEGRIGRFLSAESGSGCAARRFGTGPDRGRSGAPGAASASPATHRPPASRGTAAARTCPRRRPTMRSRHRGRRIRACSRR